MIVSPLLALTLPAALAAEPARPTYAPLTAIASDDEEEDDGTDAEDDSPKKKKKARASGRSEDEARIREIVRGFYAKANIGAATYLLGFTDPGTGAGGAVSSGTLVGLSFGQDFVDTEKQSMAWELTFNQGIHNGLDWSVQAAYGCKAAGGAYPCTEGDLRTYSLQAAYEFSVYPARRFGIGIRAGGGALYSPLLIESIGYQDTVINEFGVDPGIHNSIHPYGFAGPTLEYYTKLSHFSISVDADVFYAVGWDLGLNASLGLKYTL